MDIVKRVKAIMLRPESEWRIIAKESGDPSDLFTNYVAILASIPAVAGFIGASIVGIAMPAGGNNRLPIVSGLFGAIFGYVLAFVVVFVMALVIDALAGFFGGRRSLANALKLSAYSYTPFWLAGIVMLIPGLRFLTVLGLYGLYLLWTGLPPLMQVPRSRAWLYATAIVACALAAALALGGIQSAMFALRRGG